MKRFLLMMAIASIAGSQWGFAQNRVKSLSAERETMDVQAISQEGQTVRLSRYLYAGYNTLCLPMSLTAEGLQQAVPGAKLERLAAVRQEGSKLCLYFVDCTREGIEAGMPYLIFTPAAKYMQVKNVETTRYSTDAVAVRMADSQGNRVSFGSSWNARQSAGRYGIPAKQNVTVLESVLVRTHGEQTFLPTRCGVSWESQSATATELEIKHIDSTMELSAVKAVATEGALVDVYDLKGNALLKQVKPADAKAQLPAGVYIIGGEKVTIK